MSLEWLWGILLVGAMVSASAPNKHERPHAVAYYLEAREG